MAKKPVESSLPRIHAIRKEKVVLDSDLAALYGVPTFRLNEAVKRNADRFPPDFRFQLTREEVANLTSQIAISSSGAHGGRRQLPWAFTEHGALMAANILRSGKAVQMSIYLIRAFVKMRDELMVNAAILKRLAEIDRRLLEHDSVLREVVERLQPLLRSHLKIQNRHRLHTKAATARRATRRYARRAYLLVAQRRAGAFVCKPSGRQVFSGGERRCRRGASLFEDCSLGSALLSAKNTAALPVFNFKMASNAPDEEDEPKRKIGFHQGNR